MSVSGKLFQQKKFANDFKKILPSVSKKYLEALTPVQHKTGTDQQVLVRRNRKNPVKKSLLLQLSLATKLPMCLTFCWRRKWHDCCI